MKIKNIIYFVFGHDEFINGEHIAHEPSLWQRLKTWFRVYFKNNDNLNLLISIDLRVFKR